MLTHALLLILTQLDPVTIVESCKSNCSVTIPPGTYTVSEPFVVSGSYVNVDARGVTIRTSTTGVVVKPGANYLTWTGGRFESTRTATTAPFTVGAYVQAQASFQHTQFSGFGRGVSLQCGLSAAAVEEEKALGFMADTEGNCNLWRLDNVLVSSSKLDGVYVRGADANGGLATMVNSFVNCKHATGIVGTPDYDAPKGKRNCANFNEASFLGNTYVAPHSAHSIDQPTSERHWQFFSVASNARNTFVGAYTEEGVDDGTSGNGPSWLQGYGHHVYGGLNNIQAYSGAMRFREWGRVNRMEFDSSKQGKFTGKLCLGACDNGLASPFVLTLFEDDEPKRAQFRLIPVGTDGLWELEYGRPSAEFFGRFDFTDYTTWGDWIPKE